MAEGFDPNEFAAFKVAPPAFDPAEFAAAKAGPVDVGGSIAAGQIEHAPAASAPAASRAEAPLAAIPGAEGMTFPTAPGPSATARRMGEGAAAGFGDRPLGINPADRAAYPIARALQPIAAPADFLARSLAAGIHGATGAAAGAYEDLGGSPADASRMQRDLGILTQFPGEPGMSPVAVPPRVGLPRVEPVAPSAAHVPRPPVPSLATERPNTGVRLLPPEIPHSYTGPSRQDAAHGADAAAMREGLTGDISARRSAGAAGTPGTGPLAEISPAAQDKLKQVFAEEGFTPHTLEQRLEEMSSHEYLGEISPNTALHMSALNGTGGAARNEITNSVRQRSREAGERMESAFDSAFGPYENRHQIQRSMEISRDQQVQPFWQRFREMTVEPSPQIEALMPRLEAAGALQAANRALAVEGLPSRMGFQRLGTGTYIRDTPQFMTGLPAVRQEVPTAAAFQAAKEHLDDLIERSMGVEGGANDARRYTALKNDLINALDQHPDPEVAGVWRRARDEYATPTSIIKAMKTGERALTGNITAEELPFLTAAYSPAELRAFNVGIRGRLEDLAGRPGRTDNTVINTILARSNQSKIRWAIGDERANELIGAIEHEQRMHNAPNSLIYNSMTMPRQEAAKFWTPQPGLLANATLADVPHGVVHGIGMGVKAGVRRVQSRMAEKTAAEAARTREEVSRILTLQGPERDAVARALVGEEPPRAAGGRVARAKGGRLKRADGGAAEAADRALNLTPQERALYQRHLQNLTGPGGVDNPDGSRSSLFQMSFERDGKTFNIPSVWDGKILPPGEAIERAQAEGLDKFPSYGSEQEAEKRYQQMHDFMEQDTQQFLHGRGQPGFAKGGRVVAANVDPNPTEAQKEAGNYAKDHVSLHGLDIAIENPKGGVRAGMGRDGKPWSVKMPAHYGYIKGTVGRDKDHVDIYVGPQPKSPHAFVVDQIDAENKKFDEHKVMLGFASRGAARRAYLAAFSDNKGHQRIGHMADMPVAALKDWLANGNTKAPIQQAAQAGKLSHLAVGYVTKSRLPGKHCAVCSMFLPDRGGPGCTLVRDPIAPQGWCRRFAAKQKD